MTSQRIETRQVPHLTDRDAWARFMGWLRGCSYLSEEAGLRVLTIRGWEYADPTDWLLRLPGRALYRMTDERWRAAGRGEARAA